MKTMSRRATLEYLGQMRRRYATLKTKEKRNILLSEFCLVPDANAPYASLR